MVITVPTRLRQVHVANHLGQEWLDFLPDRVARAVDRWDLVLGEPLEEGMAAWTTPANTAAGLDVVVKVSYPCRETRDEAAALAAWHGPGAIDSTDDTFADVTSGTGACRRGVVGGVHDLLGFGEPYQSVVRRLTDLGQNHRQLQVPGTPFRSAQQTVDSGHPKAKMHKSLRHLR